MSLLPGLLGLTGGRSFSFYPAIHGVAHNEWRFRRANWSDFVVVNTQSGEEACIPRSFVTDVSANAPTVIVGLRREMEWRDGKAIPYRRPVVELPLAVNDYRPALRVSHPAPVVSIRLETPAPARRGRKAVVFVMFSMLASVMAAGFFGPAEWRNRIDGIRWSRSWQQLNPHDDYAGVVSILGEPSAVRNFIQPDGRVARSLDYPRRHFTAVLEGPTEADARYVASLDPRGQILGNVPDSVASMLHSIPRF